jgi:SAM-dependent methyltransferase
MLKKDSNLDYVTLDYYKTTSSAFDDEADYSIYAPNLERSLAAWLDVKNKSVIDLGCGTGQLCWVLKAAGAKKVVGVNLCKEEIDLAKCRVDARFEVQDILRYLKSAQDESIDNIYALNIFEHLEKDYLMNVLTQCARVLKTNGSVTAIVPNATSPFGGMTRYWDITHVLSFTPSSVNQLKNFCGFKLAEFKELGPKPHGIISGIRYLLWRVIRLFIMARLLIETASVKGAVYTADFAFRLTK